MAYQDELFEVYQYHIDCKSPQDIFYLIPFGDIHRYTKHCDVHHWLDFCEWAKTKKNCYFLGMGDYDDLSSFSERRVLTDDNLHESTKETLDEIYRKRVMDFAKEIGFMKGKLVGLIEGNHYSKFSNGSTTTQMLCSLLGCKYLGRSCAIRMSFNNLYRHSCSTCSVDIYAHHGLGGASRTVGGSLNKVQQMDSNIWADIYLQGHDHRKSVGFQSVLYITGGAGKCYLRRKKILYARTGSFLRGYVDGEPSYVAAKAMVPTDLGVIKIELTPKRETRMMGDKRTDMQYLDIHTSI